MIKVASMNKNKSPWLLLLICAVVLTILIIEIHLVREIHRKASQIIQTLQEIENISMDREEVIQQ